MLSKLITLKNPNLKMKTAFLVFLLDLSDDAKYKHFGSELHFCIHLYSNCCLLGADENILFQMEHICDIEHTLGGP